MKTMGAGAFKAKCLSVMEDVHNGHGEVVVTKRGTPLVKVVPIKPQKADSIFGCMRGEFEIVGDVVSPITEPWEWDEDIFPPGTAQRDEFERNKKAASAKKAAGAKKSANAKKAARAKK